MASITIHPDCEKKIIKLFKKNRPLKERFFKQIDQLEDNPTKGNPKSWKFKGLFGIHINPYVLIYEYDEGSDVITILDFDHHDVVYEERPKSG